MSASVAPRLLDGENAQGEGGPKAADDDREVDRATEPDRAKRGEEERDDYGMPNLHANAVGESALDLERHTARPRSRRAHQAAPGPPSAYRGRIATPPSGAPTRKMPRDAMLEKLKFAVAGGASVSAVRVIAQSLGGWLRVEFVLDEEVYALLSRARRRLESSRCDSHTAPVIRPRVCCRRAAGTPRAWTWEHVDMGTLAVLIPLVLGVFGELWLLTKSRSFDAHHVHPTSRRQRS